MPHATTWDLDDIFPESDFDLRLDQLREHIQEYATWYQKLQPDMAEDEFRAYIAFADEICAQSTCLDVRASLMEAADQKSAQAKQWVAKCRDVNVLIDQLSMPCQLWLRGHTVEGKVALDKQNADRLFTAVPGYEVLLRYAWDQSRYDFDETSERVATISEVYGATSLKNIRELIETGFTLDFNEASGEKKVGITLSEVRTYVQSIHKAEREQAYQRMLSLYRDKEDVFFLIYQNVVKEWVSMSKLRGYDSSRHRRCASYMISEKSVDAMLATVQKNKHVFQDFFRHKARVLGDRILTREHIYAPIYTHQDGAIDYDSAVDETLATFEQFSPRFAAAARSIIDARHVDVYPRTIKRGGAFCCSVTPRDMPYVMLNFTGALRDTSTLAHELGHGVHALYASGQPIGAHHAPLPLAETASTTGEMLLFDAQRGRVSGSEKKALLAQKIADSYATIVRQAYFTIFEMRAHEAIMNGASRSDISALWLETLREQFGDAVEVSDEFRYEWAYIPHIVDRPFYCLSYTFGELLSLALYQRYKEDGQAFVPAIERILEAGGSCDPRKLLLEIDIDIEDTAFWQNGFDVVRGWVEELKKDD